MKTKSASNRIRHSTPQHRRSVRRRAANRARIIATVLGSLSLLFALIFMVISLVRRELFPTASGWQITFAYAAVGLILFGIRYLLGLGGSSRRKRRSPRMPPRIDPSRQGMVLILTLVMLGVLSALALHLQHSATLARQSSLRQLERTRLRLALLDEGFLRLQGWANDEDLEVDHLDEEWMATREVERPDGIVTLSRLIDLNRYADFNNLHLPTEFAGPNLSETILIEAMTHAGDFTPIERLEAVRDWIDPDDDGIRESAFYARLDPPYHVPNTWLHSWSELMWIAGFSPDYFDPTPRYRTDRPFEANLKDLITIIPGPRDRPVPVNINTATAELIESLVGTDNPLLARYIQLARTERPFRSLDALLPYDDGGGTLQFLRPFAGVRSTHVVLDMQALQNDQRIRARAIAERSADGNARVLQWVMN